MMITYLSILLLSIEAIFCQTNQFPEFFQVNISKGPIIGKLLTSYDNEQAYTFLGIPLAKPTVGKLRFIRPQPVDPWKKPIYTTEFRNACMADAALTYKKLADGPVSEDCLYMNVYASHHCLHLGGCPVMIVIHGGRFTFESPVIYNNSVIVHNFAGQSRNIIVVTVPYRLGIFGFINLPYGSETPLFERNQAIRDLHFEFEWVQNEIRNFGGDPSKVTVYGHSAGAQIVKIISMLPKFDDLFQNVVVQSGNLPESALEEESNTYATIKIAKLLGCINANATVTSKDNERIIDCMIIKSSQELVAAQNKLDYYVEDIWGPYVDGEMIPDQYTTLRSRMKKRNLLIGTVLHEMKSTEPIVDKRTGHVIENRLQEICHDLAYLYNVKDPLTAEAACIAYYSIGNKSAQINDDMQFYVETVNHANANLDPSKKTYVYSYIYSGAGLAYDKYNPFGKLSPAHSEDFIYIFGMHRGKFTEKDYQIEKIYSGLIANFVKTGDPSIENQEKWLPWNREKMNHYLIDFDKSLKMPGNKPDYYRDPYEFWELALPGLSGWSGEAKRFPIGVDCCLISHFVDGLVSHWTNKSAAYSKTLQAEEETYQRFKDLVKFNEAELAELDAKKTGPSKRISSFTNLTSGSNVLLYVATSLGILIFVFGLMKFIEYRKRRAYNPL